MWIWQAPNWPHFTWDKVAIEPLVRQTRLNQGVLLGKMTGQSPNLQDSMLDTLLANILHSSAIEDELLNAFSVRSSLAKKLGVSENKPFPMTDKSNGVADITFDAVVNFNAELTIERILLWHSKLFAGPDTLLAPVKKGQLRGTEPMQVVSGRLDKPTVHFEAPARSLLDKELMSFINWFNQSRDDATLDPLLRAAITHLRFITLHPLDDGNGRIARLLTDLALAQAEQQSIRFYAMSVGILANRKSYYDSLEMTQRGDVDITSWLVWFLNTLNMTFANVINSVDHTLYKTNYWRRVDQTKLHPEQVKVLNRMLDGDFELGINTTQYHKVAKVSKPTATRHLVALVSLNCLVKSNSGGRSTRYLLPREH